MALTGDNGAALPGWNSQSFPSIDPRVGWAITMLCLLIALLLTVGVLRIQIGPLPGTTWLAIVCAQVVTAIAVAAAAHFSARRRQARQPTELVEEVSGAPEA